jgi:tRNA uridine 5-carboxymethylaminomethyl modification enzyme
MGLINEERWKKFQTKMDLIAKEKQRLASLKIKREDLPGPLNSNNQKSQQKITALEALKRPEVNYVELCEKLKIKKASEEIFLDVVTEEKYAGYIARQKKEIKKILNNENALIPEKMSYEKIRGLSNESKQKLIDVRPRTIAHAQRIPGITPATISLLLVHLKKTQNWKKRDVSSRFI